MQQKRVDEFGDEKIEFVPEVAIHIKKNKETGEEFINPNEVHGNGPNQGIKSEYLEVARQFVMQKKPDGTFRFTNAQEFEMKFSDTIMFNNVKDKIEKLKDGGKDLVPNELKFLYEVYKQITSFELNGHMKAKMEELRKLRYGILRSKKPEISGRHIVYRKQEDFEREQIRTDYEIMFDVKFEEIFIQKEKKPLLNPERIKVFVGDFVYPNTGTEEFVNLEEITGKLFLNKGGTDRREFFTRVKKINGITITDDVREKLINNTLKGNPGFIY